jgi:hypothetical protein
MKKNTGARTKKILLYIRKISKGDHKTKSALQENNHAQEVIYIIK